MNRRLWIVVAVLAGLLLASLACDVPEAILNIDPTAVAAVDPEEVGARARGDAFLRAEPSEYFCRWESIQVDWYAGEQYTDCRPRVSGSLCKLVDLLIGSGSYSEPTDLGYTRMEGSMLFTGTELAAGGGTGLSIILTVSDDPQDGTEPTIIDQAQINLSAFEGTETVQQVHELACDRETNTWQWVHGDASLIETEQPSEDVNLNPCQALTEVCAVGTPVTLTTDDGVTVTLGQWECTTALAGYSPATIQAVPTVPGLAGFVGDPCSPSDTPPRDPNWGNTLGLAYDVTCSTPDQMHGQAAETCAQFNTTTSADLIPPGGGGGGSSNELGTCGPDPDDGVCCVAANETTATDPACASAQTSDSQCTSPEQGGVQWQGTICGCDGVERFNTVCANGQQITGGPTGITCAVAADCQPSGGEPGSEPGDVCQDSVCGDGDCDFPACEDSLSCPADCFG